MLTLALLLLTANPKEDIARERCDVLEGNSFYDENGRLVFNQLIVWQWNDCHCRHECHAWRMVKGPSMWPERDWGRGGYSVLWIDGEVVREVRAETYNRTHSQFDPELIDRCVLPREQRRELRTIKTERVTAEWP